MQYGDDEGWLIFTDEMEDVVVFAPGHLEFWPGFQEGFQAGFALGDGVEVLDDFGFIAVSLFDAPSIDSVVKDSFQVLNDIRSELTGIRHWKE